MSRKNNVNMEWTDKHDTYLCRNAGCRNYENQEKDSPSSIDVGNNSTTFVCLQLT